MVFRSKVKKVHAYVLLLKKGTFFLILNVLTSDVQSPTHATAAAAHTSDG